MHGSSQVMLRDDKGRIVEAVGLTAKQAEFVRRVVRHGENPTQAARSAGYNDPKSRSWEVSHNPRVIAAIRAETERCLYGELAPLALNTWRNILRDPDAPVRVRADVAKAVMDRSGHGPTKPQDIDNNEKKDITDMSQAELEAFIRRGSAALEQASKPMVNITPNEPESGPDMPQAEPSV